MKSAPNNSFGIHMLELIRLRIALINDSSYCINLHYNELKQLGDSDIKLSLVSVWNMVPYFTLKEQAFLGLTDFLIIKNTNKSFHDIFNLLTPHFNNEDIYDLIFTIKQIDRWTKSIKNSNSNDSKK